MIKTSKESYKKFLKGCFYSWFDCIQERKYLLLLKSIKIC